MCKTGRNFFSSYRGNASFRIRRLAEKGTIRLVELARKGWACWAAQVDSLEGACDHAMACSTCHVYVVEGGDKLAPPSEEELDMLDLAFEPKENSRLACQITMGPSIEGLVVEVPAGVSNRLGDDPF